MNDNNRDELYNIDKYDPSIIAERIKDTAYSKNITIKEVLTAAGLSINYVQQMQHDNRQPRLSAIARIADVLAVSVDSLLDRAAGTANAAGTAATNTDTTDNAPPSVSIGQAVQTIADYMHISPDYVRGALHLPPDDKNSTL